jgi:hypothetical protein
VDDGERQEAPDVATANERHFRDAGVPWINPTV